MLHRTSSVFALALVFALGCSGRPAEGPKETPKSPPSLTDEDVRAEIQRLPPLLRQQFRTEAGQREFKRALNDKELLIAEARRLGYAEKAEIAKEVTALEERLIVKALLADEEKRRPITESEAREFFERNKEDYREKEAVRASRILFAAARSDGPARSAARRKAEGLLRRIKGPADFQTHAAAGQGSERVRGGDLGFLEIPNTRYRELLRAVRDLSPGTTAPLIEDDEGFSIVVVTERRASRLPVFDDVKNRVMTDMLPRRQRAVFDDTIRRLRALRAAATGADGEHL